MQIFVRGNQIDFSTTFAADAAPGVQPTSASLSLAYNLAGTVTKVSLALTLNGDGTWSTSWDSSTADGGRVDWSVVSHGIVVAADEGFFILAANNANTR